MDNVLMYLTQYKARKAQLDTLKAEVESMKAEITSYVLSKVNRDDSGKARYVCGQYVVTVAECSRTSLDEKAIRELFPDIAKEHENITTFDRLTVK